MDNSWGILADLCLLTVPNLCLVIVQMQASFLTWQILAAGSESRQRKQVLQLKLKALGDANMKEL